MHRELSPMKGQENLKPSAKGRKGGRRQTNPAQLDKFCLHYHLTGSAERAAVEAGYRPSYGYELLHKPEAQQRLREIREKFVDESTKLIAQRQMITLEFLDAHLVDVIRNGGGHPRRGEADRLKGIEIGLKMRNLIGSPDHMIAQSNPSGATTKMMYRSKWIIERDERLKKECDEEFAAAQRAAKDGNGTK
jgi:hypothetical protein